MPSQNILNLFKLDGLSFQMKFHSCVIRDSATVCLAHFVTHTQYTARGAESTNYGGLLCLLPRKPETLLQSQNWSQQLAFSALTQ